MNNEYLARAREVMKDSKELIVIASRRARSLAMGARPMVRCKDENFLDVALLEIAEGKLSATTDSRGDFLKEIADLKEAARNRDRSEERPAAE